MWGHPLFQTTLRKNASQFGSEIMANIGSESKGVPFEIAMQYIKWTIRHLVLLGEQRSLWERHTSECVSLSSLPTPCHSVRMTEFGCDKLLCRSMRQLSLRGDDRSN